MPVLGLLTSSIFEHWADDPQASASLAIAVFGGGAALYRFRSVPRERRRETLDAMQKSYSASASARSKVLPQLPAYLLNGKNALTLAVAQAGVIRSDLQAQLDRWSGLTNTAAHEIARDEAKFRALLWAIAEVKKDKDRLASSPDQNVVADAQRLVNQLNDFSQMVELGLFAQDDVLGQLHRSVGAACKAVEPLIWQANVYGGRWGLRVLRMQLRAEHYNDVKEIHRSSELAWRRADGTRVVMSDALYRSDYGRRIPSKRYAEMPRTKRWTILAGARYARARHHYGGYRLRKHAAAENDLIGRLKFATSAPKRFDPLALDWKLKDLETSRESHWRSDVAKSPGPAGGHPAGSHGMP
jgi:hypothetical protein